MTYTEYISYHKQGDAGVEERMIASLSMYYNLSNWDAFRLIYYYAMTYHIPSALDMLLKNETRKDRLKFRTDRRYVRCHGAFERMLNGLSPRMMSDLKKVNTTSEAYSIVRGWYYFGRYAAFLFLEVYYQAFSPDWIDDIKFAWEVDENYTKGAEFIAGTDDRCLLDSFLDDVRRDTKDNAFAIETSLCAVAKIVKGTRYNGYYTERMLNDAENTDYSSVIMSLL